MRVGNITRDPMRENMEDSILEWDFIDVKLMKGKYFWNNRRIKLGYIVLKLDRF